MKLTLTWDDTTDGNKSNAETTSSNNNNSNHGGRGGDDDDHQQQHHTLEVLFPYDGLYPEQHQYMKCLHKALDRKGHCLLEMPPGSGTTSCLLALLTSHHYQYQVKKKNNGKSHDNSNSNDNENGRRQRTGNQQQPHSQRRRIVYATNTVSETRRVTNELAVVMSYRKSYRYDDNTNQNRQQQQQIRNKKRQRRKYDTNKHTTDEGGQSVGNRAVNHYNDTLVENNDNNDDNFLALCLTGSDRDAVDTACRTGLTAQQLPTAQVVASESASAVPSTSASTSTSTSVVPIAVAVPIPVAVSVASPNNNNNNNNNDDTKNHSSSSFRCGSMTTTQCDNPHPTGIFSDLEQLREWNRNGGSHHHPHHHHPDSNTATNNNNNQKSSRWCCFPHLTKYAIQQANVLIVTYPYLLDPMTARMISGSICSGSNSSNSSTTSTTNGNNTNTHTNSNQNQIKSDTVIVFDQAHNIDAACVDALSATVNSQDLEQAGKSLDRLLLYQQQQQAEQQQQLATNTNNDDNDNDDPMDTTDTDLVPATTSTTNNNKKKSEEYHELVNHPIDYGAYENILLFPSHDVIEEPVPGNIRQLKHFVSCMKKIIQHFRTRLKWALDDHDENRNGSNNNNKKNDTAGAAAAAKRRKKRGAGTGIETSLAFLHTMTNATQLDAKTIRFVYARVTSILRTVQLHSEQDQQQDGGEGFSELINVAYLASLLGFTNTIESTDSKFAVVLEKTAVTIGHHHEENNNNNTNDTTTGGGGGGGSSNNHTHNQNSTGSIQLACLDPSLAVKKIFDMFDTVILTSSTLSPIHYYPKMLQFTPIVIESIPMTTFRPCVNPIMISRGDDQQCISTSYKERYSMGCMRTYGKMLVDLISSIPDGIVVYFPSYQYMEALICEWDATDIMRELTEWKLVFVDTRDNVELNTIALDNYRASCDIGRGGVFFSVARGNISETVPFDLHYGRAIVMIGIPYDYTLSKVVQARLGYLQTHLDVREDEYLTFDAVRQVSKCFGRSLRSKTDYSVLVLADSRFHRNDQQNKLPRWVTQFLPEHQQNLSTDMAVTQIKTFLRQTGQPIDQKVLQQIVFDPEKSTKTKKKNNTTTDDASPHNNKSRNGGDEGVNNKMDMSK